MDLSQFGRFFVVGFFGTRFGPALRDFLEEMNPSGVILFSRNIEDPLQITDLNHDIQVHAHARQREGAFIAVDQEGGRVARLREPFVDCPPALVLARSQDPASLVADFAGQTARELKLAGFNLNFVPVMDVLREDEIPENSVIGDRAFGVDPSTVARLGLIVLEAMRAEGIIPCCKHFPGHGGTTVDSHADLPLDGRSLKALGNRDLVPFREAVKAKVEMIMTAHVVYPGMDPDLPATLSQRVVDGLLRQSMGFDGVVITDDLDMRAVADRWDPEERAVAAFSASADILLVCNNPEAALAARSGLYQAVRDGTIENRRIRESLRRITFLKAHYAASMRPCDPGTVRDYFRI